MQRDAIRSRWGWGFEDAAVGAEEAAEAAAHLPAAVGLPAQEPEAPVALADAALPPARIAPPGGSARGDLLGVDRRPRGTRLRQVLPGHDPRLPRRLRARPRRRRASARRARGRGACSSGPAARERRGDPVRRRHERRRRRRGAAAGALRRLRSASISARSTSCTSSTPSRARRCIGAGAAGPRVEQLLGEHGLTMRFFPQSFELSTLGGWIATRAGGHFATRLTHVDDLVESVRAITPAGDLGVAPAARVGSGPEPGPDADRLGGDPGRDHARVGPRAAAARASRVARVRFDELPARRARPCARSRSPASTRRTAG